LRKMVGTLWDRITRNDINSNFEQLYNDVGNISGKITDDMYEEIKNNVDLNWDDHVNSVSDLPSDPTVGTTILISSDGDDYGKVFRYDGSNWKEIFQMNPDAIFSLEERLQKEIDKKETPEGAQEKADKAETNAKQTVTDLEQEIYGDDSDIVKVVESGSNANGEYIRYSDGMQYCWGDLKLTANVSLNSLYRSESEEWTYPKAFKEKPYFVSASAQAYTRWADIASFPSKDSCSIVQFATSEKSNSITTLTYAVGRWK